MINKRLVWYLESKNLITPIQSGFRSERSTSDHFIRLETFIRDAFVNRDHAVAVFFFTWKRRMILPGDMVYYRIYMI